MQTILPACNDSLSSDIMPSEMGPPAVPKFLYRNGLQKEPPSTDRWAALSQKSGPIPDGYRPFRCTGMAMLLLLAELLPLT